MHLQPSPAFGKEFDTPWGQIIFEIFRHAFRKGERKDGENDRRIVRIREKGYGEKKNRVKERKRKLQMKK